MGFKTQADLDEAFRVGTVAREDAWVERFAGQKSEEDLSPEELEALRLSHEQEAALQSQQLAAEAEIAAAFAAHNAEKAGEVIPPANTSTSEVIPTEAAMAQATADAHEQAPAA